MKRSVVLIAGMVAAGAALWLYESRPVRVETATVVRGDIPRIIAAKGTIVARKNTEVSAGTMGRVEEILVHEGDLVNPGQVLVRLDPAAFRSEVESARQALERAVAESRNAEVALESARRKAERAGALEGKKLASEDFRRAARADEEAAESARDTALRAVAEARDRVDVARGELQRAQVVAPTGGRITAVRIRVGETVADGHGPVLLSIARPGTWDADVAVPGGPDRGISRGNVAAISAGSGRTIAGSVARVDTGAAGETRVRIEIPASAAGLTDGLPVSAAIEVPGRTGVPILPARCLVEATGGSSAAAVFLVENGEARRRSISVGLRAAGRVEVAAGLHGGESVVAGPAAVLQRLRDGERVSPESGGFSRWL